MKTKKATPKITQINKAPVYTEAQANRRTTALLAAAQLVSNPVHAFAANPQNVMELANVFWHFVEGKDLPATTQPVKGTAEPVQEEMKYA